MRPHLSMAALTMAATWASSVTFAPSAMACPPDALMWFTTSSAAESEPPLPSRAPPRSLTTTFAPRAASASAWDLPRPLPAPVTIATFPSYLIVTFYSLISTVMSVFTELAMKHASCAS